MKKDLLEAAHSGILDFIRDRNQSEGDCLKGLEQLGALIDECIDSLRDEDDMGEF